MNKKINLRHLINNSKQECNCRCCNDKTGQFHTAHCGDRTVEEAEVSTRLRVGTEKGLHFEGREQDSEL